MNWFARLHGTELTLMAEPESEGKRALIVERVPEGHPLYHAIAQLAPGFVDIDIEAGTVKRAKTEK